MGAHREDDALQARPRGGGLRRRRRLPGARAVEHVGLLDDGRHEGDGQGLDGWVKDNGLEKPIKGGYFDNEFIDAKGVKKVKDLPTMPDLMLKLCVSLNLAGSLGIAKAVKA